MMSADESTQLMMMIEIFELDKEYIGKKAKSEKCKDKAKWVFSTLTNEQRKTLKKQWYQTMETMEINIPMFTYVDIYATTNNINYPFTEIDMFQKDWNTTSEKKVISTHPPLKEAIIKVQNSKVITSPFKKINFKENESRNANLKDIKSLQQQNNFTNQILGTIATQMDRSGKNMCRTLQIKLNYDKPFFKPPEIVKPIKFGNYNKNEELYKILAKK